MQDKEWVYRGRLAWGMLVIITGFICIWLHVNPDIGVHLHLGGSSIDTPSFGVSLMIAGFVTIEATFYAMSKPLKVEVKSASSERVVNPVSAAVNAGTAVATTAAAVAVPEVVDPVAVIGGLLATAFAAYNLLKGRPPFA
jgi:hypothetical protein